MVPRRRRNGNLDLPLQYYRNKPVLDHPVQCSHFQLFRSNIPSDCFRTVLISSCPQFFFSSFLIVAGGCCWRCCCCFFCCMYCNVIMYLQQKQQRSSFSSGSTSSSNLPGQLEMRAIRTERSVAPGITYFDVPEHEISARQCGKWMTHGAWFHWTQVKVFLISL